MGDAIADGTAASLIQMLGHALQIGYYRVAPEIFGYDSLLDARVWDALRRMTRSELEAQIKKMLFVDGFAVNMTSPEMTRADRALTAEEMDKGSLRFSEHGSLVRFAFGLWKVLDYIAGAERVDAQIAKLKRQRREAGQRASARRTRLNRPPL